MNSKTPVTLLNFFVFNSSYCEKEGDESNKIIYYYPENTDLDTRMKNVGLCEAVIKFTETFSSTQCETLHTQKTRQIFLQPENGFWMVMTLGVPTQQKVREGQVYLDYYADEIQDHVCQSVLVTLYRLFTLLKGTFCDILARSNNNIDMLKQCTEQFFSVHLPSLKVNDVDLLDVFQGIHFLPLERFAFLKIQSFINITEEKFKNIKYLIFLYSDQLVWTELDQENMQVLYQHLSTNLIPLYVESELKGGIHSPSRCSPLGSGMHFGRFMTGPKTVDDVAGLQSIPKVYLNNGKHVCHLVIYRALNATICLLIDENCELKIEFFKELDAEIGSQLSVLASEIGEQYSKSLNTSSDLLVKHMYMYFNHMNLAQKTSVHTDMKKLGHSLLPSEVMKLLADLNSDLSRMKHSGEIMGKTVNDCWVVGKLSSQRELYVVLQQKNANIVDVNEELRKISFALFQNIFIFD